MRQIAPQDPADAAALETREWLDSLDYVLQSRRPRARRPSCFASSSIHAQQPRRQAAVHRQHALHQHHPRRRAAAVSRQPRDRAPHQEPRPLERDGDGRARQPRRRRHRRPHLHLRLVGHAVRSRLQPLLPRPRQRRRRRPRLLPGPRLARHLRARVPRRPADARSSSRTSAASCSRAAACRRIRTRG